MLVFTFHDSLTLKKDLFSYTITVGGFKLTTRYKLSKPSNTMATLMDTLEKDGMNK